MLEQLLAIIRNTFVESLRQPVLIVVIGASILALIMSLAGAANTLDDDTVLLIQIGLSILLIAGVFMAAFTATGVLSLEVENKTVLTVVSKPVARPLFILGKFAGVTAALTVAMWPLAMLFLLVVRHGVLQTASHVSDAPVITFLVIAVLVSVIGSILVNYLYRWVFVSTCIASLAVLTTGAWVLTLFIGKEWVFQSPTTEFTANEGLLQSVLVGLLLLYESLLIFCAIAIAVSTRLGQVLTIVITLGLAFLIALSESWLGRIAESDIAGAGFGARLWQWIASVLYHVLPNLQFLWLADDLSIGTQVSLAYVATVSAYSGLFIVAVLGLAVALFQTREVG